MSVINGNSTSNSNVTAVPFVDRRKGEGTGGDGLPRGSERRQFGNSYNHLTPEGKELAEAIDRYKIQNRRRYVTTDELLSVLTSLGYHR